MENNNWEEKIKDRLTCCYCLNDTDDNCECDCHKRYEYVIKLLSDQEARIRKEYEENPLKGERNRVIFQIKAEIKEKLLKEIDKRIDSYIGEGFASEGYNLGLKHCKEIIERV